MLFTAAERPGQEVNNMQQMTGLTMKIQEMAARIRELRSISGYSVEEIAQ